MSNKPTHIAYVISQPKENGGKGFWREVGAAWPHKDGDGFDILIHEGISVYGKVVCRKPKEKDESSQ